MVLERNDAVLLTVTVTSGLAVQLTQLCCEEHRGGTVLKEVSARVEVVYFFTFNFDQ
jgi:hypothetical protein